MIHWGWIAACFVVLGACSAGTESSTYGGKPNGGAGGASADGGGGSAGEAAGGSGGTGTLFEAGIGGSAGSGATAGAGGADVDGSAGSAGSGGCSDPPPGDQPVPEVCGDGLDNDLNGFVDEGCPCGLGQTQSCFGGYPSEATLPNCVAGTQSCKGGNEFSGWGACTGWQCGLKPPDPEICGNGLDDNCNGLVDEGCGLDIAVNIDGDCVVAACPPQAPFPVGCNISFSGGDSNGCVSTAPGGGQVYFQEGVKCPFCPFPIGDSGHLAGTLKCSSVPGPPLDATSCPINKPSANYPTSGAPCPVCGTSSPPWCGSPGWGCPG